MNLSKIGFLTAILLLPILLCCSTPEGGQETLEEYDVTASDLLDISRLLDDAKIDFLKAKGWAVVQEGKLETDSEEGDKFAYFKKNEECWDVYQTWDRGTYNRLKTEFERLGYEFQMQGSIGMQYMNYGWDHRDFLGIVLMQTREGYFVMLSRSKVKADRPRFVPSDELMEKVNDDEYSEDEESSEDAYYDEEEVVEDDTVQAVKTPFGGTGSGGSSGTGRGIDAGVNARKRK